MRLLSIDVGIKNLAYCLLDKHRVSAWGVVDLVQNEEILCDDISKNKKCGAKARFVKDSKHYCLRHAKKQSYLIPTKELKRPVLNKMTTEQLRECADKYSVLYSKESKKKQLVQEICTFVSSQCFDEIEQVNTNDVGLVAVGKSLKKHFDAIFSESTDIDYIVIENQISPIANRMKTLQGMIAQYFIMRNPDYGIEFVSSANKLKHGGDADDSADVGGGEKTSYNQRKKEGIRRCENIVKRDYTEWYQFFVNNKKKDDLADAMLQGMWYLNARETKNVQTI